MASRFFDTHRSDEAAAPAASTEAAPEVAAVADAAGSPKRIALVVGIGNYADKANRLPNPANDADLIGDALRELGFHTVVRKDIDKKSFDREIIGLGERIRQAGKDGIGFFYFSGHGIQHGGVNYMMPSDADIPHLLYLDSEVVAVDFLVRQLAGSSGRGAAPVAGPGHGPVVIALDACRDCRISGSGAGSTHGLSEMRGLPPGTIVAFATDAGRVADDGDGTNSPFATALARRLREPDARLDQLFNRVAGDVQASTGERQCPALFFQGRAPEIGLRDGIDHHVPAPRLQPMPQPQRTTRLKHAVHAKSVAAVFGVVTILVGRRLRLVVGHKNAARRVGNRAASGAESC